MPICIILDPLNWTRPDLIHIEGDRGWHQLRTPEGAAVEAESPQSRPQAPALLNTFLSLKFHTRSQAPRPIFWKPQGFDVSRFLFLFALQVWKLKRFDFTCFSSKDSP